MRFESLICMPNFEIMNMRTRVFLLLSFTILATACKPKQLVVTPTNSGEVQFDPMACGKLSQGTATHLDRLSEVSIKREGDCLYLNYSYNGGCEKHDVELFWDGNWAETNPPSTHLFASHNAHEDACKAKYTDKKGFNIKPLQYAGVGNVNVDVHVQGWPAMHVDYNYAGR